jgi:hypothetical protein
MLFGFITQHFFTFFPYYSFFFLSLRILLALRCFVWVTYISPLNIEVAYINVGTVVVENHTQA